MRDGEAGAIDPCSCLLFTHQVPLEPATVIAFQVPYWDRQLARERLDGLLPPRMLLSHPPPPCFRAMGESPLGHCLDHVSS